MRTLPIAPPAPAPVSDEVATAAARLYLMEAGSPRLHEVANVDVIARYERRARLLGAK